MLTANTSRSKNGSLHYYYQCRGKNGAKHSTYTVKRDESHEKIVEVFKNTKVNKETLALYDKAVEEVYLEREAQKEKDSLSYTAQLKELDRKEKNVLGSIEKLIDFPAILEKKNSELEELKAQKVKVEIARQTQNKSSNLAQFKHYSKQLITHLDKLVLHKENPEFIKLAFEVVFG